MIREILKIKTDNGKGANDPTFHDIEITEYSYKGSRMGMPELTATLMFGTCLDEEWTQKEYVEYNGERYYIRHTPSSSKDNKDTRYKHDIVFTSEFAETLGNTYFEDAVMSHSATYDKPCSNNSTFSFFGTISDFVDRLNCAFDHKGIGDSLLKTKTSLTTDDEVIGDGYCAMLDELGDYDREKTYEFSWEDKTLWEAITEGYNITKVPFERRGRKIIFGARPVVVSHEFEYGHDNELLSINKKNANAKVINRITMLGSEDNIPYFYPNETEYGHINIVADTNNNVLKSEMITVENMSQLLSRLNANTKAVLSKYGTETESYTTDFSYQTAFGDSDFSDYMLGRHLPIAVDGMTDLYISWHIKVTFTAIEDGTFTCKDIKGNVWKPNETRPEGAVNLLNDITPDSLVLIENGIESEYLSNQLVREEDGISLGFLKKGQYAFQFSIRLNTGNGAQLNPHNIYCYLLGLTISKYVEIVKKGYYWAVDDKKYDGIGGLGISISEEVTDEMLGDGFSWQASGRMPFQQNLMPPIYRETLGTERYYNALNGTYPNPDNINPETGLPIPYVFPNPYIEGSPSEHIYRDEEIKPTIEGVKNASEQLFGKIAGIAFDKNDNDLLKSGNGEDSDKNDPLKYEHSYFYIKLNIFNGEYGFDLFKSAAQTGAMTLQITSGSCNGCKFKVQAVKSTDKNGLEIFSNPVQTTGKGGTIVAGDYNEKVNKDNLQEWQQNTLTDSIWICVQKDASTFGEILPNVSHQYKPIIGDTFNIIDIAFPHSYILAAEKRLEEAGIRYMADNNEEKFTFDISASRIFFADNPDVLNSIDEYSKIKIKYNGFTYEQYINELSVNCKDNELLPDIGISLTEELAVGKNFVQRVAENAASLIANPYTMGGASGTGSGVSVSTLDARYLNKQKSDRTPYKLSSDVGFEVGEFVSGGSGGIFYQDTDTGLTWIEADMLKIRMKAIFEELMISKISSIRGENMITPGGSIDISYIEETPTAYRCYFKAKENDKGAGCQFVVGDQIISREFNIMPGLTQSATNGYYWRLVTAVDNDGAYIELSKTDCATGSGIPQAGDTICQLGNRTDKTRQSAIILSTVDAFAPSVTLYSGINSYSLVDKSVVEYGVDKTKNPPEPFFHCYGSFFFGPRNKKSYLQFEPSSETLVFKGNLELTSTIGDKPIDEYITGVVPPVTQEDIEGYVNNIVDPQIENIQNQIDGVIETWFSNGVPTLTNYPASEWEKEELKIQHLGDLYYDNDTGTAYRFSQKADKSYYWNVITDDAITKALAAAQAAQDTADGKRRVFTSQPTPPYDEGDLWANATYGSEYNNDLVRCIKPKTKGDTFDIRDWILASKYTDDTSLNKFLADYERTIADIQGQIDGKAQTWYQADDPALSWADEDKPLHIGDLWYNTNDGTTWYWDGTAWQEQEVPTSVFDAIDGKADIFVSKPTSYHANDLWFLERGYTLSGVAYKAGTLVVAKQDSTTWNANHWVKKDKYTDDTLAQKAIDRFDKWAEDGVFSPTEIKELASELERIAGEKAALDNRYNVYKDPKNTTLETAKTAYDTAYDTYSGLITGVINATPDADGCVTVPTNFMSTMQNYYNVRAQFDEAITLAAKAYSYSIGKSLSYLEKALAQDTIINGGLIMSSIISMGVTTDKGERITWAGMNGIYERERTIASWWGGPMIDRYYSNPTTPRPTPLESGYAMSLVRMDGSGYFSGGNIRWDENGAMTFGSGILIDLGNGGSTTLDGISQSLDRILELFTNFSNIFVPETSNGQSTDWTNVDAINRIRINRGIYSTGFISARGSNDNGGSGGGGATELRMLSDVNIGNPVNGEALVYDGKMWINKLIENGLNETELYNYLTANNYATESWVNNKGYITADTAESTYVKKSGDTMTGTLHFTSSTALILANSSSGLRLQYGTKWLNIKSTGLWRNNTNQIWDSGNDGAGSGLDADLLDGIQETSLFRSAIDTIKESDILTTLPGDRSGSYVIDNSDWYGSATVFYTGMSNSGLAFYRPGGSNSIPKILVALDSKSEWTDKGTILTTQEGNAVSASKLNSPINLWGQSFDGSGSVSGTLNDVTDINIMASILSYIKGIYVRDPANGDLIATLCGIVGSNKQYSYLYYGGNSSSPAIAITSGMNVGIGTKTPTAKLDVYGGMSIGGDAEGTSLEIKTSTNTDWNILNLGGKLNIQKRNTETKEYEDFVKFDYLDKGSLWLKGKDTNASLTISPNTGLQIVGTAQIRFDVTDTLASANFTSTVSPIAITFSTGSLDNGSTTINYTGTSKEKKLNLGNLTELTASNATYRVGNLLSRGYVTARSSSTSSDERLKTIIRPLAIDIKKIAQAPSVVFKWKEDDSIDVGSIAQYWQRIDKRLTPSLPGDELTLQYGKAALLSSISIAKEVVSLKDEIRKLKGEINRLNVRIAKMGKI